METVVSKCIHDEFKAKHYINKKEILPLCYMKTEKKLSHQKL